MFDEATELDVVEWFQGLGEWLEAPMGFFTQLGNPLLFAMVRYDEPFLAWFEPLPLSRRLGVAVAATALLVGAGAASVAALGDFEVEPEWEQTAAGQIDESEPFDLVDPTDIGSTSGIFADTAIALVLLADRGGLANARGLGQRLARFGVGAVCLIVALALVGTLGGATALAERGRVRRRGVAVRLAVHRRVHDLLHAPLAFERFGLSSVTGARATRGNGGG